MFSTTMAEEISNDGLLSHFTEHPLSSLKNLSPLRSRYQQQGHVSLTQASRPSTTSDNGAFTSGSEFFIFFIYSLLPLIS